MKNNKKKLRILHIHHALYVNHLLVRGLRELGYTSVNAYFNFQPGSPHANLTWGCDYNLKGTISGLLSQIAFLKKAIANYDIFHFWANPFLVPILFNRRFYHFPLDLWLIKNAGKKIVWQSDGCNTMILPSSWKTQTQPDICEVCHRTQGEHYRFCSDSYVNHLNRAMKKYADLTFGIGMDLDFEKNAEFSFFPVDSELWNPAISIPPEYVYPRKEPESVLVFHGLGLQGVPNRGNIKGTEWIKETISELRQEEYNIELMYVEAVPNKVVRFYQAQADIVVDQLLFPGGGQMSRECLALGKPVLTRVHPRQVRAYEQAAAPHDPPPYVPTDRENIRENLIRLIENPDLRYSIGKKSAEFAENVLSPRSCAQRYVDLYMKYLV
jgi:hypothetical protein